jgi:hypothetical protein
LKVTSPVSRHSDCRLAWRLARVLAVAIAAVPAIAAAQVLDRIVATVGAQVITLSDARAAISLGLVPAPEAPSDQQHAARATLSVVIEKLVDRELMRAEIERYGVAAPPPEALEPRIEAVRKRFATPAAFDAALAAHGLSDARFRAWIVDDWRIEHYIQQRFDAAAQPTDEDVLQYYQSREREFTVNDRPRPFAEVREEVRRRLTISRRQALIDDWVNGLKRRTEIMIVRDPGDA